MDKNRKKIFYRRASKIDLIDKVYETHSNYVLCKLSGISSKILYDSCLKKGILIRETDNFRGLNSSFVRFAIKDRKKNLKLINILKNINKSDK